MRNPHRELRAHPAPGDRAPDRAIRSNSSASASRRPPGFPLLSLARLSPPPGVLPPRFLFLLPVLALLFSCAGAAKPAGEEEPPEPSPPVYLTLAAAGDNLIHAPVLRRALGEGAYNFDFLYEKIKPLIRGDINFINQETVFGGPGFSGYPLFNTPREAGISLAAAGFNVINHATNHAMDRGEEGVLATMDFWDTLPGVHYLGISRSEEYGTPLIIERNSIRVGFLSFTYGTNGIPLPGEKPFLVSLIDPGRMAGSLDKLRPLCDYMAVSLHWGKEYEGEPDPAQESLARLLAEHGADLIIGHHPHVLQKVALFPRPGGGTTCCVYSLGNFFAFQETPLPDILLGGLLLVRLKKTEGRTTVDSLGIIPLISHGEEDAAGAAVYPLHEYTGDLFEKHRLRGINKELSLEYFLSLARKRLGPYLLSGGDSPGR